MKTEIPKEYLRPGRVDGIFEYPEGYILFIVSKHNTNEEFRVSFFTNKEHYTTLFRVSPINMGEIFKVLKTFKSLPTKEELVKKLTKEYPILLETYSNI